MRERHGRRTAPGLVAIAGACLFAQCLGASVLAAPSASPSMSSVGLRQSDVPGFAPTPTGGTLDSLGLPSSLAKCAPGDPLLSRIGVAAVSTVSTLYAKGENPFGAAALEIATAVLTTGIDADAEHAYQELESSSLQSCWLAAERAEMAETTLVKLLSSSESSLPPLSLGSNVASAGFTFHMTVSVLGRTLTVEYSVTAIRVGAILTLLFTAAAGQVFPESVRAGVAQRIADRMGGATPSKAPKASKTKECLRSGVPDPGTPVLTTAQVENIVGSKATFRSESSGATSVCTWAIQEVRNARTAKKLEVVEWRVAIDGPLASTTAAYDAYLTARKSAAVAVLVPDLGDHAALLGTDPMSLVVQAGTYSLGFSSSAAPPSTGSMILTALATRVLTRLHLTSPPQAPPTPPASTDWAGPTFCKSYGQPVRATFRGVASCGENYVDGSSNTQGAIWYREGDEANGAEIVEFDATGFQCVEYANRYFYYMTGKSRGKRAGAWTDGDQVATALYYTYKTTIPGLGLVPLLPEDQPGGTRDFEPTLHVGDIVSMWSSADPTGHVGVVEQVDVTKESNGKYKGQITLANENAQHGTTTLTVKTNVMIFPSGGFTTFQWLTGLPTS